jgi:adhesin transport system outer membrane protein
MRKYNKLTALFLLLISTRNPTAQTLPEAVRESLLTHPEVLLNRAQTITNKQAIDVAKGAYFPSVDMTGGYGREWTASPLTQDLEGDNSILLKRREFNIAVVQNIFSGGAIVGEVNRNRFLFQAQRLRTVSVANDMAIQVTEAYLDVLLQRQLVALNVRNLAEHTRLEGLIEERSAAGISRHAEVYQGRTRVALAESNLISARSNLRKARIQYKKLVGSWPLRLHTVLTPPTNCMPKTVESGVELGVRHHPLMKSATADINEARSQYHIATGNMYPKVDAVYSVGRNQNLDGLQGHNNDNLTMIRFSYNLFKGGADVANIKKAASVVQEAIEKRYKVMIEVAEKVRLAYNSWDESSKRSKSLAVYASASLKTRNAYLEQFKIGERTFLDLLNTQNESVRAEIDYLQAKNDALLARYRILNSTGFLIPFLAGKQLIRICSCPPPVKMRPIQNRPFK